MTTSLTRRHLLTAALATGVAIPLDAGRGWAAPARLTLPHPPDRTVTMKMAH